MSAPPDHLREPAAGQRPIVGAEGGGPQGVGELEQLQQRLQAAEKEAKQYKEISEAQQQLLGEADRKAREVRQAEVERSSTIFKKETELRDLRKQVAAAGEERRPCGKITRDYCRRATTNCWRWSTRRG